MRRINFLGKIPREVTLACSGGVDSMAVLDFLRKGRKDVTVLNFNHGTEYGGYAAEQLEKYCKDNDICFIGADISIWMEEDDSSSLEARWHKARYAYFKELRKWTGTTIITCHHLDDQVENWIMTAANGNPVLIPYENEEAGVIRPFLLTRKNAFESWCERNDVPYWEDPSNKDTKYTRNLVRHEVLPVMLKVNPGLHKVVAKKVRAEFEQRT